MSNILLADFIQAARIRLEQSSRLEYEPKIIELNTLISPLYYFSIQLGYDKGNIPHLDFFFLISEIKASAFQIVNDLLEKCSILNNSNDVNELIKFRNLMLDTKSLINSIEEVIKIPDTKENYKDTFTSFKKSIEVIQKRIDNIEYLDNPWDQDFKIKFGSESDKLTRLAFYLLCSGDTDNVYSDLIFKSNGDYNSDFFPIYGVLKYGDCDVSIQILDLAILKDPKNLFAKMLRCIAFYQKDEREIAIEELEKLISFYPRNPLLKIELSYFYYMFSKDPSDLINLALEYKDKLPFNYLNYVAFEGAYHFYQYRITLDELTKKLNDILNKNVYSHDWIYGFTNYLFQLNIKKNLKTAALRLLLCQNILNHYKLSYNVPLLIDRLVSEGYTNESVRETLRPLLENDEKKEKIWLKEETFNGYRNSHNFTDYHKIIFETINPSQCRVIIDEKKIIFDKNSIVLYDFNMFYDDFERYYLGILNFKNGQYFISNNENKLKLHLYKMQF